MDHHLTMSVMEQSLHYCTHSKPSVLLILILNWRLKNQWIENSENHNLFAIVSVCVCGVWRGRGVCAYVCVLTALCYFILFTVVFKKPITPVVTPQDLIKYLEDPNYSHEDIESTSPLKDGVSELPLI